MKFFVVLITLFYFDNAIAQHKVDTLLGTKGIFSKMEPKYITTNAKLSFNIKLTLISIALGGSKQQNTNVIYLNTVDGFIGMDKAFIPTLSSNNAEIDFVVETITKQSIWYTNNKTEGKVVKKLPTNLITTYKNLPIKKADALNAKPKKYLSNTLVAEPYFLDVFGVQKQVTRFLYGNPIPAQAVFKSYLGNYSVGFYNISDVTYLCIATESNNMKMEITKIEKVNISFDTKGFIEKN